jgi:thiamine-phosphate pyrophosphorylase
MNRKYYFISKFERNNIDKQDKETVIIYRDYSLKNKNTEIILNIKKHCKKKKIKFYLANNVKLAIKFDLDGAYIPSFNRDTKHLGIFL